MSITLLASDRIPLKEICSLIRDEGGEVSSRQLDADFYSASAPTTDSTYFLILEEQDLVKIGETTNRVRGVLGKKPVLILCIPLPVERSALLNLGANDIITPAVMSSHHIAERILAKLISDELIHPYRCGSLYGATKQMRDLYAHIERLAPLDDPLLILGEMGTGKELVAREVHNHGARADVYIAVNCAELSPELLGSELFGHEKGAFTNAIQTRKGLLAEAGKGTIFLDEIGDLDLQAQAKLLRVLEEKKIRRVGANHWEDITARILLATNRNLEEECQAGRFRPDLFERIRGFTLMLPPLRERKGDIPLLAKHFAAAYGQEYKCQLELPPGATDILFRYEWPGNVRELRSAVRKAAAYADKGGSISSLILQETIRGRKAPQQKNTVEFDPSTDTWRDVQRITQAAYFKAILVEAKGNKDIAIKLSGLSKSQFYEKLRDSKDK
jgi:two-component system response regulator HydG